MSELKTYQGGCHCGQIRYEVSAEIGQVIECNCSICMKRGLLLAFVTAESFQLLKGNGHLREYLFNTKKIRHLFCPFCGVESFARGTGANGQEMVAINVRCLDGIDVAPLTRIPVDGKSL